MILRRCLSAIFVTTSVAAVLLIAAAQPAIPQARGQGPAPLRVTGPAAPNGQQITFNSPQFIVQALWFKANDETGWAWTGSDEIYAVFSDWDPNHYDHVTSDYEDVDEGDTVNFSNADQCMAPQATDHSQDCDSGMAELNVRYSFWEEDFGGNSFCNGDIAGSHDQLRNGKCPVDDLIGRGEILHSAAELAAMLPTVGASREFAHVMDQNAGKYRFRYRITRVADLSRSIVIHLPPVDPTTPPNIMLQAVEVTTPQGRRVRLTWTGATTSTVDVFRNDVKVVTTANDGDHLDATGNGTFRYRLCNLNSTTVCSPEVTIVVN